MTRRKRHRLPKDVFLIIVDGQTEKWYLEMMKESIALPRINIKPELPKKKELHQIVKAIERHKNDYDKVIWLVDYDEIRNNHQERKFQDIQQRLAKFDNIEIIANNPCLEFWFLLHFCETSKLFPNCKKAENALKKYLNDYEKTEAYFKNHRENIYQKLIHLQSKAIQRARKLDTNAPYEANSAKAQLYRLFEILGVTT
ncbi:MAG TPA: RloB domain-containing protein [Saprospiraceae bacterium]|nr:RloB domain-containing protein [Saprospiraceae bacterium]